MTSREVVSKMAQLIPVAVLREYQMDEENYLRSQMAYRARRIASFKERDIPHIVERFTSEVRDRDVQDCVLCLYILEDLISSRIVTAAHRLYATRYSKSTHVSPMSILAPTEHTGHPMTQTFGHATFLLPSDQERRSLQANEASRRTSDSPCCLSCSPCEEHLVFFCR